MHQITWDNGGTVHYKKHSENHYALIVEEGKICQFL